MGKISYICIMKATEQQTWDVIPTRYDNNDILNLVHSSPEKKGARYFNLLKSVTKLDDKEISEWLSINEKTYRSYKKPQKITKAPLLEHAIMIISLFKHGIEIFGSSEQFKKWLDTNNFYFDNKSPGIFMDTATGIKFIDDRLTGIEYGDNA